MVTIEPINNLNILITIRQINEAFIFAYFTSRKRISDHLVTRECGFSGMDL